MKETDAGTIGATPEVVAEALEGYAMYVLELSTDLKAGDGEAVVQSWPEYLLQYLLAELGEI